MKKKKNKRLSNRFKADEVQLLSEQNLTIVDQEQHELYQKLDKHPILNSKSRHIASDGTEIKLATIPNLLLKKIEHLPQKEQTFIMKLKDLYQTTSVRRMTAMKKAYGQNIKKNDDGEVIYRNDLDIRKDEIVELFGRMYTIKEVHEICLTKFKLKKVTVAQLKDFRIRNAVIIQERIEEFKRDYTDLRLAIKKGRLEEIIDIYNKMKRKFDASAVKKNDDARVLMSVIEQIRKEAEGDTLRVEGLNVSIDVLIQGQVNEEMRKTLPLMEIVLGRIAANSGVPVEKFLGQLNESWYNKAFDGRPVEDIPFEEIPDPTAIPYDFDLISRQHALAEKTGTELQTIDNKSKKEAISLKEALLAKLKEKQGDVNYTKNDAASRTGL